MNELITTEEVATLLKIEVNEVERLLHGGQLRGLKLAGSWRIRQEDLAAFIEELQTLAKELQDPRRWASVLSEFPDFKHQLAESDFEEGTVGSFLKEASETADAKAKAGNVVDIESGRSKDQ